MNILIDILPTSVNVNNMRYEIYSNFRTSILFALLMSDNSISDENKIIQSLELYYPILSKKDEDVKEKQENLLVNYKEALDNIMWFYRCGEEIKNSTKSSNKSNNIKLYDFESDGSYIFSSFYTQYNLDLQDIDYLHWWKFMSLFNSLQDNTKLAEAMKYRSIDLSTIKDKEQKKFYKEMQKLYSLDEKISDEELEEIEKVKDEWK